MTHSNHRRGSRESLDGDYVVLVRGDKVKALRKAIAKLKTPQKVKKG